jgi:hypothetical protein
VTESSETLLRTRVAVDQVMLSRLATQSAIERSRNSLAETRALLVALQFAVRDWGVDLQDLSEAVPP